MLIKVDEKLLVKLPNTKSCKCGHEFTYLEDTCPKCGYIFKKVAFWNRMSHLHSVERKSHENHFDTALDYCTHNKWIIVIEYELLEVKGKDVRKTLEYQRYRLDVEKKCFDIFFLTKVSRYARKVKILFEEAEYLKDNNIQLIIKEIGDVMGSVGAKMTFMILSMVAEIESDMVSERLRESIIPRANKIKPLGNKAYYGFDWTLAKDYGYDNVLKLGYSVETIGSITDKTIVFVPNEIELAKIGACINYFVETENILDTLRYAESLNILTKPSSKDKENNIKGHKLSDTTFKRLILDAPYDGIYIRNKHTYIKDKKVKKDPSENIIVILPQEIKNILSKYVNINQLNKAREILETNKNKERTKKNRYPLIGLLKCPSCGLPLYGHPDGFGRYRCQNKSCGYSVSLWDTVSKVNSAIEHICLDSKKIEQEIENEYTDISNSINPLIYDKAIKQHKETIRNLEDELKGYIRMNGREKLDDKRLDFENQRISDEITKINKEIQKIEVEKASLNEVSKNQKLTIDGFRNIRELLNLIQNNTQVLIEDNMLNDISNFIANNKLTEKLILNDNKLVITEKFLEKDLVKVNKAPSFSKYQDQLTKALKDNQDRINDKNEILKTLISKITLYDKEDKIDIKLRPFPSLIFFSNNKTKIPNELAGVHRRDQNETRRIGQRQKSSGDRHFAVLQRLAQYFQHRPVELREFIQKKHAEMGQRYLARFGQATPTDNTNIADRMMRCSELTVADQSRT